MDKLNNVLVGLDRKNVPAPNSFTPEMEEFFSRIHLVSLIVIIAFIITLIYFIIKLIQYIKENTYKTIPEFFTRFLNILMVLLFTIVLGVLCFALGI